MSFYEAKFKREAKENPIDWIIIPEENKICKYRLFYVGK